MEGIIHNTEIYQLIQQGPQIRTKWVKEHPLVIRNQSHRLKEFENMQKAYKSQNQHHKDIKILQELAAISIKPIEILEFTNKYDPIPFPGVDVGQGISSLIKDVSEAGATILNQGSQLIENVIDKGVSVTSEPIKAVIIAASIVGGIIVLLIAYKYFLMEEKENANVNMATKTQLYPHIWKKYNEYHEGKRVTTST